MRDVLLICMPFGPVFNPSLGLSLLQAGLARHRISSRVRYFTIDFAERIGQNFYCDVAYDNGPPVEYLTGDWIFSAAVKNAGSADDDAYVDDILLNRFGTLGNDEPCSPAFVRRVLYARRQVPGFLDHCLNEVLREEPRIVGFSSIFQQHAASLALARAIRHARPDIRIVFGGANCEGVMGAETLRRFPFIDAIVSGEGDIVFPELVRRVLGSEPIGSLQGVRTPGTLDAEFEANCFPNAPAVVNLDDLPCPDHEDYFEQFRASRYDGEWQPSVPFETSRGCWWGERRQCTFCGLNGRSLAFRSKSAGRAVEELVTLVGRYPDADVDATDNILDMRYFSGFLPEVADRRLNATIYYETKSNLKKDQIRMLRDAGVRGIQPGIESFSDRVLALMRKGVTGLQNIQLLKWCKEFGVEADWNLICGFPGEPPEEYARMAALVPLLTHLRPPISAAPLRLDRFSPIFCDGEKAGITRVQPMPSYRHVYPLPEEAISNIAYYFTFEYRDPRDVGAYVDPLRRQLREWRRAAKQSDLFAVDVEGRLVIWDLRPAFRVPVTVLTRIDRALYLACDGIFDLRHPRPLDLDATVQAPSLEELRARLDSFAARGLAVKQDDRYLALAVLLGEYVLPPEVAAAVYRLARLLGRRRGAEWIIPLDTIDGRSWRLAALKQARRNGSGKPDRRRRPLRRKKLAPDRFSVTDLGELAIR